VCTFENLHVGLSDGGRTLGLIMRGIGGQGVRGVRAATGSTNSKTNRVLVSSASRYRVVLGNSVRCSTEARFEALAHCEHTTRVSAMLSA
jgi:hypothetical protein